MHFLKLGIQLPIATSSRNGIGLHRLGASSSCPLSNKHHLVVIIIPSYMHYEIRLLMCRTYKWGRGSSKNLNMKDKTLTHRVIGLLDQYHASIF